MLDLPARYLNFCEAITPYIVATVAIAGLVAALFICFAVIAELWDTALRGWVKRITSTAHNYQVWGDLKVLIRQRKETNEGSSTDA